ncbi:uncharacterized protein LOC115664518 isoform X1 [Syzygium oleosum]|uniref:uncharacterized protein LOC115664518 isoform X1 n=2 Tax=Syzygium oleosum TaxID=219896 RepID=UPI0024BBD91F|nr:uncharacterized protein LOC115664518 isoform X1 [Syzygium oleosum]
MPRGRSRQKQRNARNTRMDAALDAMRQYGFPERMVRETVRELLKVYTGEWHFIEVDAYMALIEALLEKQNQWETKEVEASTSSRKDGDTSTMLVVGPSSGVVSSEHEAEAAMSDTEATEAFSQVDEALPLTSAVPTLQSDCPPGFEGYRRGCEDVRRDHDSNGVHLRSRRCYHGWIGGEEEAEIMQLTPPLLPEYLTEFISRMEKQRPQGQRKRRWDVRPEDL